jgi:hypothetical protein
MRVPLACLALSFLIGACTSARGHRTPRVYAQAFDTETNACLRFPASCPGAEALAVQQRVAEAGTRFASIAATLYLEDKAQQIRVEQAILGCVQTADFKLNERFFGSSPSREQCAEVVERGPNGEPVTRAMLLGRQKHTLALECIQQELANLRSNGFSVTQRYRENRTTGRWEPLSKTQVEALLRKGGSGLAGTIEPDIVIHTGNPAEVLDVFDLKFPCPGTNPARWHEYAPGTPHHPEASPHLASRQASVDWAV